MRQSRCVLAPRRKDGLAPRLPPGERPKRLMSPRWANLNGECVNAHGRVDVRHEPPRRPKAVSRSSSGCMCSRDRQSPLSRGRRHARKRPKGHGAHESRAPPSFTIAEGEAMRSRSTRLTRESRRSGQAGVVIGPGVSAQSSLVLANILKEQWQVCQYSAPVSNLRSAMDLRRPRPRRARVRYARPVKVGGLTPIGSRSPMHAHAPDRRRRSPKPAAEVLRRWRGWIKGRL